MNEGTAPRPLVDRLLAAHGWLVYLFFYAPIIVLTVFSFNDNSRVGVWTRPSLRWYGEMFRNDDIMRAIRNTLIVAAISTVVSVVLGTAAAISMERFRFRGQRAMDGLLYLPIIIPDVTMAVMMLLFFVQAFDLLESLTGVRLNLGLGSISLAHIAFNISYVAVVVRARLAGMDPYLTEAAADLYAGPWQTFRRVTLPLIMPGVAGGALLALTLSLPVYVFGLVRREVSPLINAVSTAMLLASILLVGVSLGFQQRSGARQSPSDEDEGDANDATTQVVGHLSRVGGDTGGL